MLYTPRGVRDLLPQGAREKSELEHSLAEHFSQWGYDPVVTPTFEFLDILRMAEGAQSDETLYRFVDREGHVLALRPEMTVPIARLVASRLKDAPMPLRLQYTGSVFRYDEPQSGRLREFTQIGMELIGAEGPEADAEVIAMTISAMMELGLSGFRIDLGHIGFTSSVLQSLGLPAKVTGAIRRCLLDQDYVGLGKVLDSGGADHKVRQDIQTLIELRGDADILERAKSLARTSDGEQALENVSAVYRHLEAHGVAGWVRIDLGMLKHVDYYTGIVVEGYTSDMGYSLCSGGRYDSLLQRFGYDVPATGLAIGAERLLLALARAGASNGRAAKRLLMIAHDARRAEACSVAWRLRQQGYIVEVDVIGLDRQGAIQYAAERQIPRIVLFEGPPKGAVELIEGDRHRHMPVDDLLESGGATR